MAAGAAHPWSDLWPRPGRLAWRVAHRNFTVWRKYARASAVGNFLDPLFYLVLLGMGLGRAVEQGRFGGASYMEFLAPGMLMSTAMYTATFECTFGAYTRMHHQKTYASILATPVAIDDIVLGEILFGALKSAFGATTVLLVATLLGLVASPAALLAPLAAALLALFFASAAMIVSSLSPSYEFFNYYFTLAVTPMFLFSGIFFPLDLMPTWAQRLAAALPLTHGVDLARGLLLGSFRTPPAVSLAFLAFAAAVAFVPATVLVRRRMIR